MKKQVRAFITLMALILAITATLVSCDETNTPTETTAVGNTQVHTCGATIPSDAKFCPDCGSSLGAETGQTPNNPEVSETTEVFETIEAPHVHAWNSWTTALDATCTAEGKQERTCSCGEKETQSIAKVAHTEVVDEAVASTCEEKGKTQGKHCSVCNMIIVPQSTIALLKHSYTNGKCTMCGIIAESQGLKFILNEDGKSYSVEVGSCRDREIYIPTTYNGLTVNRIEYFQCCNVENIFIPDSITTIAPRAFFDTGLKSIVIPDSVTSIGSEAFSQCYNLSSVTISRSVKTIEDNTFYHCTSLTSIVIPDSVTMIDSWAFSGCSNLTTVTIPNSVRSMGQRAFEGCKSLTSVNIPENLMSIPYGTFGGCTSLTSIIIPDGIMSIDRYAFRGCTNLISITIPNSVVSIEENAFADCSNLKSIYIGKGVASISSNPFNSCENLTIISVDMDNAVYYSKDNCLIESSTKTMITGCQTSIIPSDGSVTIIGQTAFMGCSTITNITIPDSVKTIRSAAFSGCSNLTNILIGTGVTNIENQIFRNCDNLKNITVKNGNRRYHSNGNCLIETAKKSLIAGCSTSVIPSDGSVTSIGDYAFFRCNTLTNISIPDGVESIGYMAFEGSGNLTNITLPKSLMQIGSYAFNSCQALKDIYFGGTKADWYNLIKNTSLENINVTIHYDD